MNYLTQVELENLSFPDCEVEKMILNPDQKIVEIYTDRCYIDLNEGKRLFNCKITLSDWEKVEIVLYQSSTQKFLMSNLESADILVDICEFIYGNKITLKGFGKQSGQWLEYSFMGGSFSVEYMD